MISPPPSPLSPALRPSHSPYIIINHKAWCSFSYSFVVNNIVLSKDSKLENVFGNDKLRIRVMYVHFVCVELINTGEKVWV